MGATPIAASTFFATANYAEAVLWAVLAVGFALAAFGQPHWRRVNSAAAVVLLLFGLSDVVEVQTGAWWRPWWLLAWKGGCVAVVAGLLGFYVRERRRAANAGVTARTPPSGPATCPSPRRSPAA